MSMFLILNLKSRQMIKRYYLNGAAEAFTLSEMGRVTLCRMEEEKIGSKYYFK